MIEWARDDPDRTTLERISHLLDWYPTVRDGVHNGNGGDGSGWRHMHQWWEEGSFPDLERHLTTMRQYRRDADFAGYPIIHLRQHIDWWYLDAQRKAVPMTKPVKRHGKTIGHVAIPGTYKPITVRDPRADRTKVKAGIRYLHWRFQLEGVTPRLPVDLWRIVTGQPEKVA